MKKKILFLLIIVVGVFLRFYKLGVVPSSLYWDEIINCYDSYSIGQTGMDHHGNYLPVSHLVSYFDYKNPLYTYLDVIPVKVFGLNEFGCRFPSALFGSLTFILVYYLTVVLLSKGGRDKKLVNKAEWVGLLASFLVGVSPWHLQFSRAGFEANINLFLIVLGIYLFIKAVYKKPFNLLLSGVVFGLTPYAYHSSKMIMPVLVLFLAIFFHKFILKNLRWVIMSLVIGLAIIYPLTTKDAQEAVMFRFTETNIFNEEDAVLESNRLREAQGWSLMSNVFYNRRIFHAKKFLKHYFDHFDFEYLFVYGDENLRHGTRYTGLFYLVEFPFLLAGFYFLIKNRKEDKNLWVVIFWLLLSIVPASFTVTTPHAIRTLSGVGAWQIMIGYGFYCTLVGIKKKKGRVIMLLVAGGFLVWNILGYLDYYYKYYPAISDEDWQGGYKSAVEYVKDNYDQYDKILFTNKYGRAYAYLLFYLDYPVKDIQSYLLEREKGGEREVKNVGKVEIREVESAKDNSGRILVVGSGRVPKGFREIKKINFLNGDNAFLIYEYVGDKIETEI